MTARETMKDEGVKIYLDKERTFKFDLNALCELEDKFGDISEAFSGLEKREFKKIRSIVHALLAHEEDEDWSEKDAGSLITVENLEEVASALAKALSKSAPDTQEVKKTTAKKGK